MIKHQAYIDCFRDSNNFYVPLFFVAFNILNNNYACVILIIFDVSKLAFLNCAIVNDRSMTCQQRPHTH